MHTQSYAEFTLAAPSHVLNNGGVNAQIVVLPERFGPIV